MGLSQIAAGIEVVEEQRRRGVATADDTDQSLAERFEAHERSFPCTPAAAATVVESHAAGTSVEASAREAGVAPVTAAKALHRCGVEGVTPLTPEARRVLGDWLAGDLSRTDALALTGASDAEFALATYVETHDPIPGLVDAREAALSLGDDAAVEKRNALDETMSDPTALR